MFHLTCVHTIFSSVWVAKWPVLATFWEIAEGWVLILIVLVPCLCILFTFISFSKKIIENLCQRDVFKKKAQVDEMGVDAVGIREMVVDEIGGRRSGMTPSEYV